MIVEKEPEPRLYQVSFTYDWTTISLAVLAHTEGDAETTAEEIAVDEWGEGVRRWSDIQVEVID